MPHCVSCFLLSLQLNAAFAMVGACVDNDEQVNFDTAGEHQSCADLASFCEDDSDLVEQGAPEGWLHEVCAATCGLCDAGAA